MIFERLYCPHPLGSTVVVLLDHESKGTTNISNIRNYTPSGCVTETRSVEISGLYPRLLDSHSWFVELYGHITIQKQTKKLYYYHKLRNIP
jgi:hypothetical protein